MPVACERIRRSEKRDMESILENSEVSPCTGLRTKCPVRVRMPREVSSAKREVMMLGGRNQPSKAKPRVTRPRGPKGAVEARASRVDVTKGARKSLLKVMGLQLSIRGVGA